MSLNKGFALIIDDMLNQGAGDAINSIAQKISEKGIPYCGYRSLAEANRCISNFLAVNFIILDWKLSIPEGGLAVSEQLKNANAKANIAFIREFKKYCFAPIFIFSSEARQDILEELNDNGGQDLINEDEKRNFLFIKAKNELTDGDNLFITIENWINTNPSIYTLKAWDNAFLAAKNRTFWHLFERSPLWPQILWNTSAKDSVNQSISLMEVIYKNISSRTKSVKYDETIITGYRGNITKDEIKGVIQGIMFTPQDYLNDKDLQPGDIFKISQDYYLNLRPVCDTIIGRMREGETASDACDGMFYAIKGSKMRPQDVKERYNESLETLIERSDEVILYGVEDKEFFRFSFKKIYAYNFITERGKRKCRLLPPYISHVQQKYASYTGRFGLPRTPTEIIVDNLPK